MKTEHIRNMLIEKGLKVTPQRMAILEAVIGMKNHPTAEQILSSIHKKNPNISPATVYKVLDTLVENRLMKTVKTDRDIKRYDAIVEKHHHIYYADSDKIEDFVDEELNTLLEKYLSGKNFSHFRIEDFVLQIVVRRDKTK
ncbi:MAG TPA: Fur family transcriptional regulator [Bacteroidales bacterium]|nr:Fur family transcriptional regulator [Bacteroidales bacterium]